MNNDYTKPTGGAPTPQPPAEKKVEKVVSGNVKAKKKSGVTKFADVFLAEDISNVKNYLVSDVLLPTLKKAFYDLITKGAGMFIYGDSRGGKTETRFADSVSYRNYSDYSRPDRKTVSATRSYTGYSHDDLIFESHSEASEVLTRMDELMETYHVVSVADFYELAGMSCSFTDHDYGWNDIRTANIVPVRDGWVIKLPKVQAIKSMK